MTARKLLASVLALLVLGHIAAPVAVAVIAAEVTVFAVALVALGFLLAVTRHTWWRPGACPVPATRAGGAR